jgi:hypothetical protein
VQIDSRIFQLRKTLSIDTQRMRLKSLERLEELFDMASGLAKGDYKFQCSDGKREPVTIKQRQMWARVAAYIAQIMNTITGKFDEREIDHELAELERLIHEASAKSKAAEAKERVQQEEKPTKPPEGQN